MNAALLALVSLADDVDEAEHVIVEKMSAVHADHEVAACLRELNLYAISGRRRWRAARQERPGGIRAR